MELRDALDAFQAELVAFEAKKKELARQLQQDFGKVTAELFARYPLLGSFQWRQYTPYFNDGDTCEFGVRNDEIDITYNGIDFDYVGQYSFTSYKGETQDTEEARQPLFKECYEAIHGLLKSIPDELYKEGFGDHVRVTVTANGVDVDDYDHE